MLRSLPAVFQQARADQCCPQISELCMPRHTISKETECFRATRAAGSSQDYAPGTNLGHGQRGWYVRV